MKTKRFWIIYYVVTLMANVVAPIVFKNQIQFNWFSAFPVLYILVLLYLSFINPGRYGPKDELYLKIASKFFSAVIPIQAIFILFFSPIAKALSCGVFFIVLLMINIFYTVLLKKETDAHQEEIARKRKEQEQKEELGKWK